MSRRSFGLALLAAGLVVLLGANLGIASPVKRSAAGHSSNIKAGRWFSPVVPADAPTGYQVVTSGDIDSPSGTENFGDVYCPAQTHIVGGGLYTPSTSLDVNVNRLWPRELRSTDDFAGFVDNNSDADTTFVVYAICAHRSVSIQEAVFDNPARTQSSGSVQCPPGTQVFSGGANGSGRGLGHQVINSSYPTKSGSGASAAYGWTARMNNYTHHADLSFTVYAVCGSVGGYHLVKGSPVENDAGTQSAADLYCPASSVPFGGGLRSSSKFVSVNLASSDPFSEGWENWENNASVRNATITAYAICVG